ncbi:MAG: response regulator [Bacteroidia bacterium]|nr:response regulator [Bacteroidia bacterium]MBT8230725.1 response regulator [Bacteroidia bacterium]
MNAPIILIIDDRPYDRILYKEYLGTMNYHFAELDDGEGVIQKLEEIQADIILLDWQMPRVGGLETLKILGMNQKFKDIPVIVITGQDKRETLQLAFDYGSIDFINKPVDKIELVARVQNIIALSNSQQQLRRQKEELNDLYKIIKDQKSELENTINIKLENKEVREKRLLNEKEVKIRELQLMGLKMNKIMNHLKNIKSIVQNTLTPSFKSSGSEAILEKVKMIDKCINKIYGEQSQDLSYRQVLEITDPEFSRILLKMNPKLTNLELRHCNYLKMNLNNHEIADIMNVELKSLQISRYRIKKKLGAKNGQSLRELILTL